MCSGPVGDKQSYWGLIKISGGTMSAQELADFKDRLRTFLDQEVQSGKVGAAELANGTIKTDGPDGASIQLTKASP